MSNTPLGIEIMLHHYYTPAVWYRPSRAADEEMEGFVALGLLDYRVGMIEADQSPYRITAKGLAYVEALLRVSFPEAHYVCRLEDER